MKREELIEALQDMQDSYEMDERLTYDSLKCLRLQAQINVVRDLRERLSMPLASETKGGE